MTRCDRYPTGFGLSRPGLRGFAANPGYALAALDARLRDRETRLITFTLDAIEFDCANETLSYNTTPEYNSRRWIKLMDARLAPTSACSILEDAFAPCKCVAEAYDCNHFIRFRIFGIDGSPLIRFDKLEAQGFGSRYLLGLIIEGVRLRLCIRGITLARWQIKPTA